MRPPRRQILFAMLALGACAQVPPPESVVLPQAAMPSGAGDPTRAAILSAAHVFGQPATVAGDPAAAAEALGRLEYLAAELAAPPGNFDMDPLVAPLFAQGRAEARAAFGFDPAASGQRAVDALFATAAALRAGNRDAAAVALAPLTGAERAPAALQRLAALPYLPRAAQATAVARDSLNRRNRERSRFWPL